MVSPELIAYIRDGLKGGFPITDIAEALQKAGWSNEDIRAAILLLQKEGMVVAVPASLAGSAPQPQTPTSTTLSAPPTDAEASPTPAPSSLSTTAQPADTTTAAPPAQTAQHNPPTTPTSPLAPSSPEDASAQSLPSPSPGELAHQPNQNSVVELPHQPATPTPQTVDPLSPPPSGAPAPLFQQAEQIAKKEVSSPASNHASQPPQTPSTAAQPAGVAPTATAPSLNLSAPAQSPSQSAPVSPLQQRASTPALSVAAAPQTPTPSSQQHAAPPHDLTNTAPADRAAPRALTMPHTPEEAQTILTQMRHDRLFQAENAPDAAPETYPAPQPAASSQQPARAPTTALAPIVPGAPTQSPAALQPPAQPIAAVRQQAKRHPFFLRGMLILLLGIALGAVIALGSVCVVAPEALGMCG